VSDKPQFPPEMQGDGATDEKKKGPSQATTILRLLRERYRPLLGDDGQPYAVAKDGANVALPLRGSGGLRTQAAKMYADETRGVAPSGSALTDALTVFAGLAEQCEPEPIHLRVARLDDGGIVVDQGTADGRCIVIGPEGWRQERRSPVLFRRTRLTAPMPDPYRTGDLDRFRALINVDEDDWRVIVGFMVAALFPDIPHPILGLFGLQGTAKSNATRMIINLVSPSPAPTRSSPRDLKTWVTGANAGWMTGLDNVSSIPDWLSDALCRASTGEGMVDRALYTDADVSVIAFRRVVVINGIDMGEMAGDLAERLIRVELNPIRQRRDESALWADFDEARPYALGALLDLTAHVLKALPDVHVQDAPRMADFARILAAIDQVTGWETLERYTTVAADAQGETLTPFGVLLRDLALAQEHAGGEWRGTRTELLDALVPRDAEGRAKPPKDWPKLGTVSGRIKRDTPALQTFGVHVDLDQRGPKPARERLVVITVTPVADDGEGTSDGRCAGLSPLSPLSTGGADQRVRGDSRGDNVAPVDSPDCPPTPPTPLWGDRGDNPGDSPAAEAVPPTQPAHQQERGPVDRGDRGDSPAHLPSEVAIEDPPPWLDEPSDAPPSSRRPVADASATHLTRAVPPAAQVAATWPARETGPCVRCGRLHHRYGQGGTALCTACRSTTPERRAS
jgi:hypothetical protein